MKTVKDFLGTVYHPILHEIRKNKENKYLANQINKLSEKEIFSQERCENNLFIVCTTLHESPNVTGGIARVVRCITNEIQEVRPATLAYFGEKGLYNLGTKEHIKLIKGDVVFLLGVEGNLFCYKHYITLFKEKNVKLVTFIHDLIPILQPKESSTRKRRFKKFIDTAILFSDEIIVNSNYVLNSVKKYMKDSSLLRSKIGMPMYYTHLGCNFSQVEQNLATSTPEDNELKFLMVSTIAPRKKYDQAVKAFNYLCSKGLNIKLTIIGRLPPESKKIGNLIKSSKYYNKNIFWLEGGVNDAILQDEYKKTDCVIFASTCEGFGLALYEAAFYGKPLIVRDIEVFREIANDGAFYFTGLSPKKLAKGIENWISLYKINKHPKPHFHIQNWKESAENILSYIDKLY